MLSDDICSNCENKLSGCRREVEWYNSTPICRGFVERQAHISESDFDKMQKEAADMRAELAALKEKCRWRVQGKENAPDWECILYITKNKEVRMDVGRGLEDGERWMPLPDLPKEANP